MKKSKFTSNSGRAGGVLELLNSTCIIQIYNSIFIGNQATQSDHGVIVVDEIHQRSTTLVLLIDRCTFLRNSALIGRGGILFSARYNASFEVRYSKF